MLAIRCFWGGSEIDGAAWSDVVTIAEDNKSIIPLYYSELVN